MDVATVPGTACVRAFLFIVWTIAASQPSNQTSKCSTITRMICLTPSGGNSPLPSSPSLRFSFLSGGSCGSITRNLCIGLYAANLLSGVCWRSSSEWTWCCVVADSRGGIVVLRGLGLVALMLVAIGIVRVADLAHGGWLWLWRRGVPVVAVFV